MNGQAVHELSRLSQEPGVSQGQTAAMVVRAQEELTSMAVAIVNYNTQSHLEACLATVVSEAPGEVIVVDNGSSDGSSEMVKAAYPWIVLHVNPTNLGYGAAANQALARCTARCVLLLNSDTLLRPGALQALSSYLDAHPRAAVVGPRLVNPDGSLQASCSPFPTLLNTFLTSVDEFTLGRLSRHAPSFWRRCVGAWSDTEAHVVPWVLGAALAVRRDAFEAVGGFDESFFMYFEEVDFCYRLAAAGWEVHFAPVTTIVHVGGASTERQRTDMTVQLFASTLQFYGRHNSGIRMAQFTLLVKALMAARLLRDSVRLQITRDACKRNQIREDVRAWWRVLLGQWRRGQSTRG